MDIISVLAKELSISPRQAQAAVELIDAGNTIPFIARYRKEATGALDDTVLRALDQRLAYLRSLQKRKEEVRAAIEAAGALTPELSQALEQAAILAEVEDLYRPFRPKRRTRASVAREAGLAPLAQLLQEQSPSCDPLREAQRFLSPEHDILTPQQALQGAMDILAEEVADSADLRRILREFVSKNALVCATKGSKPNKIYDMYSDFQESYAKIAPHRILAIDRGEREDALKVTLSMEPERCIAILLRHRLSSRPSPCRDYVETACRDSFSRLLWPSLERELRAALTEKACQLSLPVFSENLKNLLMQPPVKGAVTLGFDPAYRTGCKLAVVDATGKVLETTVIYPTPPQNKTREAKATLSRLIDRYGVSVIAIGNGTASKESEIFVAQLLQERAAENRPKVSYMVVSEAGASVYSASQLGAEEFPQFDVSLRSAVSIARRLQDPLAELVKIDPKSIGVGQYQHDMPPKELDQALGGVVEDCVNGVGVDLNTASWPLLSHVAGVNTTVAKNIVAYREENGPFPSRRELLKVPKLGKKAFTQCAGFLRVPESAQPLDHTAVHPESYPAAQKLLTLCGLSPEQIGSGAASTLPQRVQQLGGLSAVAQRLEIGEPTLADILQELQKPGRDPRDQLPPPLLRTDVMEMKDLRPGMVLTGTVRNVLDFGIFVDIAVHEDGLVHISQLSDHFVRHPSQVAKVGDIVQVKVLDVDLERRRISLTMKGLKS